MTVHNSQDPLIVALDFENAELARKLVRSLGEEIGVYKVGLELYAAAGPDYVRELIAQGKQVFLDLKLYDIGETVRRATAKIAQLGAAFLTVHGSPQVMRAAVQGRGRSDLRILPVTVLTSWDDADLAEAGYRGTVRRQVLDAARAAKSIGLDGVVASASDAAAIREETGSETIIVTPGIRSRDAAAADQKRVATPAEALESGANYLVIGRQITRAEDPAAEVRRIRAEMRAALTAVE